jgi:mannose-6-phosphate isomerase-like protein (cupin superfamily)
VRLHIPVVTNPEVEFVLNGVRVEMKEGECWYHNFNLPHRVANRGTVDRVHLVLDCVLNDWLREVLLSADAAATA